MSQRSEKIQASELEVMKVLWSRDEAMPLSDIRKELHQACQWDDSTIKTLLRRLCNKGAVIVESRGVYRALVTEEEYSSWSTMAFVTKIFNGSAKKMVASLLSDGQLDEDDINELSELLQKAKQKNENSDISDL